MTRNEELDQIAIRVAHKCQREQPADLAVRGVLRAIDGWMRRYAYRDGFVEGFLLSEFLKKLALPRDDHGASGADDADADPDR